MEIGEKCQKWKFLISEMALSYFFGFPHCSAQQLCAIAGTDHRGHVPPSPFLPQLPLLAAKD